MPSEDVQGEQEAAERQEPEEPLTIAQRVWNKRIDDALAPSPCPAIPEVEIDDSYYSGPLIDTHLHIPPLLNGPPRLEELFRVGEANGGGDSGEQDSGVMPSLGENISISEIACTLERGGTTKAFAFFPVFPQVSRHLLEVANRTMLQYPAPFVPFISSPGDVEGVPTVDADVLRQMLAVHPGLFRGYGEIGVQEIEGLREADDYPPDAPIFLDIYSAVAEYSLVVYLHPGEGHQGALERALREHPGNRFIVHGEQVENEIGDVMEKYSNIYFTVNDLYGDLYLLHPGETTESFVAALSDYGPLLEKDLATWKDVIEAHPDQFVWRTDRGGIALWTFDLVVGQTLVDYARAFIGRLDPTVQEKFAYKNAERLLGMAQ